MESENQPQKKKWYKRWGWITLLIVFAALIIFGMSSGQFREGLQEGIEAGMPK